MGSRSCTFCGRTERETRLVAAPLGHLCSDCNEAAADRRDGFGEASSTSTCRCPFCGLSATDRPRLLSWRTAFHWTARSSPAGPSRDEPSSRRGTPPSARPAWPSPARSFGDRLDASPHPRPRCSDAADRRLMAPRPLLAHSRDRRRDRRARRRRIADEGSHLEERPPHQDARARDRAPPRELCLRGSRAHRVRAGVRRKRARGLGAAPDRDVLRRVPPLQLLQQSSGRGEEAVAGPWTYICDECVERCNLEEQKENDAER